MPQPQPRSSPSWAAASTTIFPELGVPMNCIAPPLVYPTTSASVLVAFNRTARPGCAYVPGLAQTADSLFVVLARHAGSEHWAKLEQLGEGQQLPIELGGLRCAAGCAFRVRWANKHEATSSETDLIRTPPPATKPSSKVYALRLEFFVSPPLPSPVSTAAAAFAAGVANLLRMKSERATVAEVSASGRFLLLDLLEQDVHAYIKGKRLPEIMPLLRSHGGELNVSGHAFDAGFGVWAQAREAEGALYTQCSPQSTIGSPHKTDMHVHAGIGAPPTLLWPSPAVRGGQTAAERGGEVAAARGGAGGFGAALALLSVAVAALLYWKGASAWQRIRLNARRDGSRLAGAGAWAAVEGEDDASGREEGSDIMLKLSSVLQM